MEPTPQQVVDVEQITKIMNALRQQRIEADDRNANLMVELQDARARIAELEKARSKPPSMQVVGGAVGEAAS